MKQARIFTFLLLFFGLFLTATAAYAKPPKVTVSIRPLYFLAQELMQGIGKPTLILSGQQSPHHYHIKPSQLRNINQADIVFWVGPSMESSLQKIINNLSDNIDTYSLINTPNLHTLAFSGTEHADHKHAQQDEHLASQDPHIWLDTFNARLIASTMTATLIKHDSENKKSYQRNLNQLENNLATLQKKISRELEPLKTTQLLALHDAWQYFAHRFGLQELHGISADGLEHLGAKSYLQLKRRINNNEFECVIAGPETNYKKAQQLIAGSKAQLIMLDPLGTDLSDSAGYERFLLQITDDLKSCLNTNKKGPD